MQCDHGQSRSFYLQMRFLGIVIFAFCFIGYIIISQPKVSDKLYKTICWFLQPRELSDSTSHLKNRVAALGADKQSALLSFVLQKICRWRTIGQENKGLIKIIQTIRHRWKIAFFCKVKKILSKTLLRTNKNIGYFWGAKWPYIHIFQTACCTRKNAKRFYAKN